MARTTRFEFPDPACDWTALLVLTGLVVGLEGGFVLSTVRRPAAAAPCITGAGEQLAPMRAQPVPHEGAAWAPIGTAAEGPSPEPASTSAEASEEFARISD